MNMLSSETIDASVRDVSCRPRTRGRLPEARRASKMLAVDAHATDAYDPWLRTFLVRISSTRHRVRTLKRPIAHVVAATDYAGAILSVWPAGAASGGAP
jgi:hypothetical protein